MELCEGTHDLRVFSQEGWIEERSLHEVTDQLVQQSGRRAWVGTLNLVLLALLLQKHPSLLTLYIDGQLLFEVRLEGGYHGQPRPWWCEIYIDEFIIILLLLLLLLFLGVMLGVSEGLVAFLVNANDVGALDSQDDTSHHLLGDGHEILVVGVGPIEFAGREFGVVCLIHTLISEILSNLVDPLQATHDQHLQVEFGCHTHEQITIQLNHLNFICSTTLW